MTLPRYEHCPNCGKSDDALSVIFRCGAGHLFCEVCSAAQWTKTLKIRFDACPTCGQHTHERVGWVQIDRELEDKRKSPPYRASMITETAAKRLQSRASLYRREAARARERSRVILFRALAAHLEREAAEVERIMRHQPSETGATRPPAE